jgi:hypothetical protein
MRRRHWLAGIALCAAALPAAGQAAVIEDTFQLRTTGDLVELCSVAPSDPMGTAALNFCHGFALGVYRVLETENAPPGKLCCPWSSCLTIGRARRLRAVGQTPEACASFCRRTPVSHRKYPQPEVTWRSQG